MQNCNLGNIIEKMDRKIDEKVENLLCVTKYCKKHIAVRIFLSHRICVIFYL